MVYYTYTWEYGIFIHKRRLLWQKRFIQNGCRNTKRKEHQSERLFEIETADFNLRLTIVKSNPDSIIYGLEDLEATPLRHYEICKMDLESGDVKKIFECVYGTSGVELEIKGLSKDEIGLEYDDGCYVFGDQIRILAYDRSIDRFVKVNIDDETVSIEQTEYSLDYSIEQIYPDIFGIEFSERFNKINGGYYAVL